MGMKTPDNDAMISIRSCSSNRELKINFADESCLQIELVGFPVSAQLEVWTETDDAIDFQNFLANLGKQNSAWQGKQTWQSLEGDFTLSASCSALGNVVFDVELRGLQGSTEAWNITAGIDYELGRLAQLSLASDS